MSDLELKLSGRQIVMIAGMFLVFFLALMGVSVYRERGERDLIAKCIQAGQPAVECRKLTSRESP